jgi:hypothetical protein
MADGHAGALRALAQMEQDAIARARAEGERARAEAEAARRSEAQPAELSIPINGPYRPPSPGELAAMEAGALMLAGLQTLEARRWPLSMPIMEDGR